MLREFLINGVDHNLAAWFLENRSSVGISIFKIITAFGGWKIIIAVSLIIFLLLIYKKKLYLMWPFLLTSIVAETITLFSKIWLHRSRPLFSAVSEISFSFPSGHATIVVVFYGYISYILTKLFPVKHHPWLISVNIALIILVGLSRLYLGVHYLSDILAGYFVGAIFLFLGIKLTEKYFVKK